MTEQEVTERLVAAGADSVRFASEADYGRQVVLGVGITKGEHRCGFIAKNASEVSEGDLPVMLDWLATVAAA